MAGGDEYIGELISATPVGETMQSHVSIVLEASRRRRVETAISLAQSAIGGSDIDSIIATINTAGQKADAAHITDMRDMLSATLDAIQAAHEGKEQTGFIPCGFKDIDRKITGFIRGDVSVVGGRPSQGKSSWVISAAIHAALSGKRVHIVSLDSPVQAIGRRILATTARVGLQDIRNGTITPSVMSKLSTQVSALVGQQLTVDDSSRTIAKVRETATILKRKGGLDLLIVDYLQQVSCGGKSRYDDVTGVSAGLKAIASELDCAVVAVSQLSRNGEGRRPVLADLRESGQIEQDAYLVLFPYRPEVNEDEGAICSCNVCAKRGLIVGEHAEMIIAKQKEGPANIVIPMAWDGEIATFSDLAWERNDDF